MKYRDLSGWYLICFIVFASCKPNYNTPSNAVTGTWKFTNQSSQTYSYPSILNDPLPVYVTSWSISTDSIRATFDNNGNYSFVNFRAPKENGTYSIFQDSLLIIKPDTSAFVKFCYTTPTFNAFSWVPADPLPELPYSDFYFTSDTILFRKPDADNIIFATFWLTLASKPLQPSGDTILVNQANSNFKKY